jgi:hypothetical protein
MRLLTRTNLVFFLLVIGWSSGVAAGLMWLAKYKASAGEPVTSQPRWPAESTITPEAGSFNLVLALNPHCPCSKASVGELIRLLDHSQNDVCLHVLVYRPASFSDGWEETSLLEEVKRIRGAKLHLDTDGHLAEQFGIFTSGGMALYGLKDELLFQGGITPARGHAGDAPAQDAIRARLLGETSTLYTAPVFGCPLRESRS